MPIAHSLAENYKPTKKENKIMANKKIENLAKIATVEALVEKLETLNDDILKEIVDCPNVDATTLSDREKLSCLVFDEMRKALETDTYRLMLDCNYPQSNKHNKSDKQLAKGQTPEWLVDYYRLVSKTGKQKSLIQIYVSANPKSGSVKFNLCTSCAKANLEQFIALRDDLHFSPVGKKNADGAKTTQRNGVNYDELVDVCKAVTAVLLSTENARAEAKKQAKEEADENTEE